MNYIKKKHHLANDSYSNIFWWTITLLWILFYFFLSLVRLVIYKEPGNCISNYSYHWIITYLIELFSDEYVSLSINSQVLHRHLPTTRTNELSMITCNEYFMKIFLNTKSALIQIDVFYHRYRHAKMVILGQQENLPHNQVTTHW